MRWSEVRATFVVKTDVKRAKMIPSADPGDPADPPDLVLGLQLGASPSRAGGPGGVGLGGLPQIKGRRCLRQAEILKN